MLKNKQLKSYSGIELEEAKVKLKNSKLKNVDTL
jgi:hypothetical protein